MQKKPYKVAGLHLEEALPVAGSPDGRPPLLLVHGACHGAWCWKNWLAALPERGWHAYALSLRGHPGSDPVDDETYRTGTSVADYADDLLAAARHIGQPFALVAHSMGGIVAQEFFQRHGAKNPAAVALVLMASAPPGQLGPLRNAPVPTDVTFLPDAVAAKQYFFVTADAEVQDRAAAQMSPESPSVVNEYSLSPGVPIDPSKVNGPTLVVSAEKDRTVVPTDDRIARYLGADFHLAENIGHDLMLEKGWEHPLEVVTGWLAAKLPAG